MEEHYINIDQLINIVVRGGIVKTGVDIYDDRGVLLLEKNVLVNKVNPLLVVKKSGIFKVPITPETSGGIWDENGDPISDKYFKIPKSKNKNTGNKLEIEKRIKEINELKREASEKYTKAKNNIKTVVDSIQKTGGEFDVNLVQETVSDIINFLTKNSTAFSYVTKEIFSYDDYLYNHSVNVCTIGVAVLKKFNDHFSNVVNNYLSNISFKEAERRSSGSEKSFIYYLPEDIQDMALGLFLHDMGKVLIPGKILNKNGRLDDDEFSLVKTHSYEKGVELLEINNLYSTVIRNIVSYHHGPLFNSEKGCYPGNKTSIEMPVYVKICKLTDIYDAMTTKRSYKDALNPISVVSDLFRKYAGKDRMLQFVLHSFVEVVGIYPTGSIVCLTNGQMAYVMDSEGPIVLPITDRDGRSLPHAADPIKLGENDIENENIAVDRRKPLVSPIEIYNEIPKFLRETIF